MLSLYSPCGLYPKDTKNEKEIFNCIQWSYYLQKSQHVILKLLLTYCGLKGPCNYVNATRKEDFQTKGGGGVYKIKVP